MADKYFAIIRENPNKKWEYILTFSDDLDDLKAEIRSMQDSNDIAPNASIDYYKGGILGMKVLICGGRDYADQAQFDRAMKYYSEHGCNFTCIVHGAARGADTMAAKYAKLHNIEQKAYPADWNTHGKAAGMIRNRLMLTDNPDIKLVVAFPGGRGTQGMIRMAQRAGITVDCFPDTYVKPAHPPTEPRGL